MSPPPREGRQEKGGLPEQRGELLPRQLAHHFQESLVLLLELLVLVFNVIQVLWGDRGGRGLTEAKGGRVWSHARCGLCPNSLTAP